MADYKEYKGFGGIPYRAMEGEPPPLFKEGDTEAAPVQRMLVRVRCIKLVDEKAEQAYEELLSDIMDATNKQISKDVVEFDKDRGYYVAFLRWMEFWLEAKSPGNMNRGMEM